MGYLERNKDNLYMCFSVNEKQEAKLLKVAACKGNWTGLKAESEGKACRIVDILPTGAKSTSFRGSKNFYDLPLVALKYIGHKWFRNGNGDLLVISQRGYGILVHTKYQFYDGLPVFSCESEVINEGKEDLWIDGVTSFSYGNLDSYQALSGIPEDDTNPADDLELYYANNTWSAECRWKHRSLYECGVIPYGNLCYDRFCIASHCGLSSGEYLPMGGVFNKRTNESILWQIEHNGAWAWEIGCTIPDYQQSFIEKNYRQPIYLQVSGPRMEEAHWSKRIGSSEAFRTVQVTVAVGVGRLEDGFEWLTHYRRRKKKIKELPVIFNDYMNCFMGNSTTDMLLPYIRKAGEAGCEIFVVDCGWYDSGNWQYTFGTFDESKERYPGGMTEVMDAVRAAGMKPGLWLELESFGIENKDAGRLPLDYLFCRKGKPVVDSGRYHLDFRNRKVRENASAIIKKVILKYDLKYVKIDYNLCSGWGTDYESDSLGDGLLEHNRAYLFWLKEEINKYPNVIWENCASGGLRMDYAMLSLMDIQSVSDQEDYKKMACIAANCAAAVLPEQAGIWSYPRRESNRNETIINMVSTLLFRIHLGGHLAELSPDKFSLVKEGISCYKKIRSEIAEGIPYWPNGFQEFNSKWLCHGLHGCGRDYIAIYRLDTVADYMEISVKCTPDRIRILYPLKNDINVLRVKNTNHIKIYIKERSTACLLEISSIEG